MILHRNQGERTASGESAPGLLTSEICVVSRKLGEVPTLSTGALSQVNKEKEVL